MAFAIPASIYGATAVAPGLGSMILSMATWTGITTAALIVVGEDAKIKGRIKKEELKRENKEIESMGAEDAYSFDLRVYKNRPLKVKNIQQYVKDSKTKITKSLKKRAFMVLKGAWKMIKKIQFKGTGDLLSNWSFETHNHFDHIYVNPSLVGFTLNNSNPNP